MKRSWGLIPKILSGEKTIESRWYKNRVAPWDRIQTGYVIYLKDSGESVSAIAKVSSVLQFSNLDKKNFLRLWLSMQIEFVPKPEIITSIINQKIIAF